MEYRFVSVGCQQKGKHIGQLEIQGEDSLAAKTMEAGSGLKIVAEQKIVVVDYASFLLAALALKDVAALSLDAT
ncbi:hypothetical protein V6N12_030739 [Hibiscus sabdariffa]|uniref:Uncharacterized protein n=1 Tax=Hibiscus sabdariffa TaxID=183260 RepID=A0ABR2E8V3_9ROSI